jgi:hypothetical protein
VKLIVSAAAIAVVLASSAALPANATDEKTSPDLIARGKDLVTHGMCHDCHTPKTFSPKGEMGFDMARALSGHPADSKLPPMDKKALQPGYWVLGAPDLTVWVGPWGVSYAVNLTPDPQTGSGLWTADVFIKAMRTGKHLGEGRPILPPMPWQFIGDMSDDDLKAVFAYLHSLPPIKNVVPQPVAPPDVK